MFDDFFSGFGFLPTRRTGEWAPMLDVAETDTEVILKAELPGVKPEDLDITLTGEVLTIKGEKKEEREEKARDYHWTERRYGAFSRVIHLPSSIDPEKVKAEMKDGVLTLTISKKEEAKARQIKVKLKD